MLDLQKIRERECGSDVLDLVREVERLIVERDKARQERDKLDQIIKQAEKLLNSEYVNLEDRLENPLIAAIYHIVQVHGEVLSQVDGLKQEFTEARQECDRLLEKVAGLEEEVVSFQGSTK